MRMLAAHTPSWEQYSPIHSPFQSAGALTCRQLRRPASAPLGRRRRACTVAAAKANDVRPGQSGAGGALGRLHSMVTGFPFPIGPTFSRPTIRYEAVKDTIWTFEQPQKLSGTDVHINVRMTAIKLSSGGLLIYSPIAPTGECIELVKEVGDVTDIVLTTHAYEHKLFVAPFSRKFPNAKVWASPGQWSVPLDLPLPWLGIFPEATLRDGEQYPWSQDLDFRIFKGSVAKANFENIGSLTEVAFFHRASRTLLLTDAVICVPREAPEVVPRPQLATAGNLPWYVRFLYGSSAETKERIEQAAQQAARLSGVRGADGNMALGWQRCALLVLCLKPENLLDPNASFRAWSNTLTTSPVVERLVFSKVPGAVADWVEDMCSSWDFQRIIPCHFAAPIAATPADLRRTFDFAYQASGRTATVKPPLLGRLFGGDSQPKGGSVFPPEDVEFLRGLSANLTKLGFTIPDKA